MKKSFEEVWKIFQDDKDYPGHQDYRLGEGTLFSQSDFKDPASEESISIVRSHSKSGSIVRDPEIFYFFVLIAGNSNPDAESLKLVWDKTSLVETDTEYMESIFGGLYYEYKPPLHYGKQFKKFYKITKEGKDWSEKELIIETQGKEEISGEFIYVCWSTTA